MSKIVLGTVQFGMDYGINNRHGRVCTDEVFRIMGEAVQAGIDTFDTAYSYGDSERVIGDYIRSGNRELKLISKEPKCSHNEVRNFFNESLTRLGVSALYGYLVHNFENYKHDESVWTEFEKLKLECKVSKIGFSLYSPFELEYILKKDLRVDIIQLPFSIFDQRFSPYLIELKKRKIDVYARSVFLQGLVFKNPNDLDKHFVKITDKINALNTLSAKLGVSIASLCINFVTTHEYVDKAVIGVDSLENLVEIISALKVNFLTKDIIGEISNLRINDENILLPFKWKLSKVPLC